MEQLTSNYEIQTHLGTKGVLGKGGQAIVLAYKRVTGGSKIKEGTIVAIKEAPFDDSVKESARKYLKEEANILQSLNHKNIVKCYGTFTEKGKIYTIFEHLEGLDLFDYWENYYQKRTYIPNPIVCNIMQGLLNAIYYLGECNTLHRDIKLQNIFYTENDVVKLIDFAMARKFTKSNQYSTSIVGTIDQTMSPEMVQTQATPYTYEHDMHSIGMVMYALITLEVSPWENTPPSKSCNKKVRKKKFQNLFQGIIFQIYFFISILSGPYGQDLLDIVNAMLAKDAKNRPKPKDALKKLNMYQIKTVEAYAATKIQSVVRKRVCICKCLGISFLDHKKKLELVLHALTSVKFVIVDEILLETEIKKKKTFYNKELLEEQLFLAKAEREALKRQLQEDKEHHKLNIKILATRQRETDEMLQFMLIREKYNKDEQK
jgi:serine/threonine protein kinase